MALNTIGGERSSCLFVCLCLCQPFKRSYQAQHRVPGPEKRRIETGLPSGATGEEPCVLLFL